MARPARASGGRAGRRNREERAAEQAKVTLRPFKRTVNPYPPIEILSPEDKVITIEVP